MPEDLIEAPEQETKPEETPQIQEEELQAKPKKRKLAKLKHWPKNSYTCIHYNELIEPLRKVIHQGYTLYRKPKKDFTYDGFNIGRSELQHLPPPNHLLTEKLLSFAKEKNEENLIDVVMKIVFCLGLEQGRRLNRATEGKPVGYLVDAMKRYQADNRRLRLQVDRLLVANELKEEQTELSTEDFDTRLKEEVQNRKPKRFEDAKKELGLDPLRYFNIKAKKQTGFKKLVGIVKGLAKKFSVEECEKVVQKHGWEVKDFVELCKKNEVSIEFADPKETNV